MTETERGPVGAAVTVVLVAHGSRAEAANQAHHALADQLAASLGLPVVAGFLELAEPSIPAAIDHAVAGGAAQVLVLPYFLYPGRHVVHDIPSLVAGAASQHPGVEVRLLPAFGTDPAVVSLLAAQVATGSTGAPDPSDV